MEKTWFRIVEALSEKSTWTAIVGFCAYFFGSEFLPLEIQGYVQDAAMAIFAGILYYVKPSVK